MICTEKQPLMRDLLLAHDPEKATHRFHSGKDAILVLEICQHAKPILSSKCQSANDVGGQVLKDQRQIHRFACFGNT